MKKKYGGLGLVDPEIAKTSLLTKQVIKAMQPGESNLQLMFRYRLSRYSPNKGRKWGVSLDWFTVKLHQGFTGSKMWGHIGKAWKAMVKKPLSNSTPHEKRAHPLEYLVDGRPSTH